MSERFRPSGEEWKGIKARGNKALNTDMYIPQPVQSMGRWSLFRGWRAGGRRSELEKDSDRGPGKLTRL